ncbi:MAG: PaaX family transcriptional regulator, partial [Rhizobiales bacterium]|nr:PaaX family transcriptional regulator [Hyphomicrobiales bacterium]
MPDDSQRAESAFGALLRAILAASPLKAAGFIVTIYGDVVEPRGDVVWTGNLIETCAAVGISETLVRTAVS